LWQQLITQNCGDIRLLLMEGIDALRLHTDSRMVIIQEHPVGLGTSTISNYF